MRDAADECGGAGGRQALRLDWADGASARFHAVWLRDNALDPQTRSPGNGQRLITVLDIPRDVRIESAAVNAMGDLGVVFAPEGKAVAFPAAWLFARRYDRAGTKEAGWTSPEIELWDAGLQGRVPAGSYARIAADRQALGRWLADVRRYGFAVLGDVPTEPGTLCKVAELFGYVRETNYGRWFEVRAEVNPSNLAYTNLGLQAHTDNPYRDPVPTMQILACLENTVEGGEFDRGRRLCGGGAAEGGKSARIQALIRPSRPLRICRLVGRAARARSGPSSNCRRTAR